MSKPLTVSIPHKLGREEALRRIKGGLGSVRNDYAQFVQVNEEIWSGDRLSFSVTAMKQNVSGTIDVMENEVKLEVTLPWLLARVAHGIDGLIRKRATLMLEKK